MYGTLTGIAPSAPLGARLTGSGTSAKRAKGPTPDPQPAAPDAELAKVLQMPRKRAG